MPVHYLNKVSTMNNIDVWTQYYWISRVVAEKYIKILGGLGMEVTKKTDLGITEEQEEQMQPFLRGPLLPFLTLSLFRSHFHSFWGSILGGPSSLSIPSPDLAQTSKSAEPNI